MKTRRYGRRRQTWRGPMRDLHAEALRDERVRYLATCKQRAEWARAFFRVEETKS